jgi:hypothetical protein
MFVEKYTVINIYNVLYFIAAYVENDSMHIGRRRYVISHPLQPLPIIQFYSII